MLKLRDIMTREVIAVGSDDTLRDAMTVLARHHISGAPVVDRGRVVGVVSTTDLLALASVVPVSPSDEPGADVMPDDEAAERPPADWEISPPAYHREPWEILGTDEDGEAPSTAAPVGPEWSVLDEHTVREAMSDCVIALPPDADVARAGALMQEAAIHRVLVIEGDELLGIVSTLDVARAVADHRVTANRWVFSRHHAARSERGEPEDEPW